MVFVAVFFAVLAVAALIWGVTRHQEASEQLVRADALDERVAALTTELTEANERFTVADAAGKTAATRADEQTERAEQAEAAVKLGEDQVAEANTRTATAEAARAEALTRLETAEAARTQAESDRDDALAGAGPFKPDALWRLEVARVERLWRDRLALLPDDVSPFAGGESPVAAAIRVLADASREESGVVIDFTYDVAFDLAPDRALQVLRLGEELVASVRDAEGGELVISGGDDRTIELALQALPAVELSPAFVEVLDRFGAERVDEGGRIVLRVKAGAGAVTDDGAAELFPDEAFAAGRSGTADDLDLTHDADEAPQPVVDEVVPDDAGKANAAR